MSAIWLQGEEGSSYFLDPNKRNKLKQRTQTKLVKNREVYYLFISCVINISNRIPQLSEEAGS